MAAGPRGIRMMIQQCMGPRPAAFPLRHYVSRGIQSSSSSVPPVHAHGTAWRPQTVHNVTVAFKPMAGGKGGAADKQVHVETTPALAAIGQATIRVEKHGDQSLPANRTILILPSFSHSAHVASNADDQSPGWWEDMVGPGKTVDTNYWRVLCFSLLGSPYSSTNPMSIHPATGLQYRRGFPQVTPSDVAICHHHVLSSLGIRGQLHAVIGSSFGGMQAIQFASLFPERVSKLIGISTSGRTTPFTIGIRRMQRKAILSDPAYRNGDYADEPGGGPFAGLALARELGTLFYRSRQELDSRFSWEPSGDRHFTSLDTWEIESYLNYQGARFRRTYDANCYLLLSKCMDLMDLGDGVAGRLTYAKGAGRIKANSLFIGFAEDDLIPMREMKQLADTMNSHGGHATFIGASSIFGHDAFLKEFDLLDSHLRPFLEEGLKQQLEAERVHNTGLNAP